MSPLIEFVRESNRIEGIHRDPTDYEMMAHEAFLRLNRIETTDLERFVGTVSDGELRDKKGLDVRVGQYFPPKGGQAVANKLYAILDAVNGRTISAYEAHTAYETLHPFTDGNGRSGRVLWLWMMNGQAPLGFLHKFYYQTLDASPKRPT